MPAPEEVQNTAQQGCNSQQGDDVPTPTWDLPFNPDILGIKLIHLYLRLTGIVKAARKLARVIRRYFPVVGKVWEFAWDSGPPLINAVGDAMFALEGWINPKQFPFDSEERGEPHRISRLPELVLYGRPGLYEAIANLVHRYNAILKHYSVQDQISARKDLSLRWWTQEIYEIQGQLLERLESACDALEGEIDEDDCLIFLEHHWERMQQPDGVESSVLGIILDEDKMTASREGYIPISFRKKPILWELMKVLTRRKGWWCNKDYLRKLVWEQRGKDASDNLVEKQISNLQHFLKDLGVVARSRPLEGYRLEELS